MQPLLNPATNKKGGVLIFWCVHKAEGMEQEYKTLGEFYLAKFINLFTRLDTPEVSEALDGTLARQIAEKMTVLHACLLARRIAELKPSGWAGDGALGAEKLLEKLDEDQVCPAADKAAFRTLLSCVVKNEGASALLLRYCLMFEEVANKNSTAGARDRFGGCG